jgi:hypothetical protein
MTDYVISQAVWCVLFLLLGLFLVWRYHVEVSRPVTLRAFRQRLFALRDRAILLVAEGQFREDDPDWQTLYRSLNHSAKAATVGQMKNGLTYVWKFLRLVKPPSENDLPSIKKLPEPLVELWADYFCTVVSIVWDGSVWLRLIVRVAHRSGLVMRWLQRNRPKETASYQRLETYAEDLKPYRHSSLAEPTTVGSC